MFQPMLPASGLGGLKFLQDTYDSQLENFTRNPQHARDVDRVRETLSEPIELETLLEDPQLLRVTMTSFGLAGEEWKQGFIEKALTEATDPDSTFLSRLNNPGYTAFAEVFAPAEDGMISLTPEQIDQVVQDYDTRSFEIAVGEIDDDMRLSLNFESRIGDVVNSVESEEARIYSILGDVPIRTVLETALGLPADVQKLPIEQQASVFQDKLSSVFGITDLSQLAERGNIQAINERFHALNSLNSGGGSTGSADIALSLLSSTGAENLFLSSFS